MKDKGHIQVNIVFGGEPPKNYDVTINGKKPNKVATLEAWQLPVKRAGAKKVVK